MVKLTSGVAVCDVMCRYWCQDVCSVQV